MPTQEEIELYESVKASGICDGQTLVWVRFEDGTGVAVPVSKAKSTCSVCLREYVKTVSTVNLDDY